MEVMREMVLIARFGIVVFVGWGSLIAQGLPQWSAEDLVKLKKGDLVAGAGLWSDEPRGESESEQGAVAGVESTVVENYSNAVVVEPEVAQVLPDEYIGDYFDQSPESYFIDPQRLFSNQETLDQEGFLEYYADESEVAVRIYLFESYQQVPAPYTLERLVEDHYSEGPLTAVVFYFLGNPKRNQLMFGGEGAADVSPERLRKILESAQIKAMEKSDASTQMESFIVQLSISIYWIEQATLAARELERSSLIGGGGVQSPGASSSQTPSLLAQLQPYWFHGIIGIISVALTLFSIVMAWVAWRRSRRYRFPVLEFPQRLGAEYAAGIGSVMGFHNKLDSPSHQRDQIPGYLTRL